MNLSFLQYELSGGFIHHWLTAGPQMKGQEQHASSQPANKVVYWTPEYLLSSIQNYLPFQRKWRRSHVE